MVPLRAACTAFATTHCSLAQFTSLRQRTKLDSARTHARDKFGCCSVRANLWLNIWSRGLKWAAQGLLGADLLLCFTVLHHPVDKDHILSIKQYAAFFFFFFFPVLGPKSWTPAKETTRGFRKNLCLYLTEQFNTQRL